jgi:hypothetical protein
MWMSKLDGAEKKPPICELDLGYNSMAGFSVHGNKLSGFMKAEDPFEI